MIKKKEITSLLINGFLLIPFLLILFTVFILGKDLPNGIVSGKYFWFYGSMCLVVLVTFSASFFSRKGFRFSLTDLILLLFAGSIFIASMIINNISLNITKLTLLALLTVLYFSVRIISNGCKDNTFNQNLCIFIVITGCVEAVWGLGQLYGFNVSQHTLFKTTGSFFNPGPYAGYLAVVFPLSLYYWFYPPENKKDGNKNWRYFLRMGVKGFSGITCVAVFLVLPATLSRASWLAAVGGSMVIIYVYLNDRFPVREYFSRHKKKVILWGIIVCLFLVFGFIGMYFMKKDSADGRTLMWKVSLQMVMEHPWGVGLGNFSGAYGTAQAEYILSGKASEVEEYVAGNPEYAFNEYLQILVEAGIAGFILFILLIALTIRDLYKTGKWGMLGALISLLIFAFFSYPFSVLPYVILLVFFLAMGNTVPDKESKKLPVIVFSSLLVLFTAICVYKQYPVYNAYKQWNRDKVFYNVGLYKDTSDSYKELYPYLKDDIKFLFEYAQSLAKSDQYAESNEVLGRAMQISCDPMLYNIKGKNYQAMKEYTEAEANFIKSTQIVPNRLYPYYLLAKLYDEMGLKAEACRMAKIVGTKEPKVMSTAVKEMRREMEALICE
ncbi:MAG: O-antigen ligase family protein [Bacteroidales bacterium]|nr:O-antigen ligase family protein [Bacteroidales bacterium]